MQLTHKLLSTWQPLCFALFLFVVAHSVNDRAIDNAFPSDSTESAKQFYVEAAAEFGALTCRLACLAEKLGVVQQVKIAYMEQQAQQMTTLNGAVVTTARQTWQQQLQCCRVQAASWTNPPVRQAVMNAEASLQSITYLRSGITVCLTVVIASILERVLRATGCTQFCHGLMLGECLGGRLIHC